MFKNHQRNQFKLRAQTHSLKNMNATHNAFPMAPKWRYNLLEFTTYLGNVSSKYCNRRYKLDANQYDEDSPKLRFRCT